MVCSNLQLHVLRICVMSGKKSRVKEKRTKTESKFYPSVRSEIRPKLRVKFLIKISAK
jgi:hypothetical protein